MEGKPDSADYQLGEGGPAALPVFRQYWAAMPTTGGTQLGLRCVTKSYILRTDRAGGG